MTRVWDTEGRHAFLLPQIPASLLEDALRGSEVRSTHHQFSLVVHVRLIEELQFFVRKPRKPSLSNPC